MTDKTRDWLYLLGLLAAGPIVGFITFGLWALIR